MSEYVDVVWDGRYMSFKRDELEVAWLLWEEYDMDDLRCSPLVVSRLREEFGINYVYSIALAVAARHWDGKS